MFLERRLQPLLTLARRPLPRRLRPIAAGSRMRVDLRFQWLDQLSGLRQMRLQRRPAAKRRRARRGPNANAVVRKTIQIDHPRLAERRHALTQQAVEEFAMRDAKVAQRVMVQAHSARQPTIGVVALAQIRQRPRAAHAFARRKQPQRQKQSPRRRRAAGRGLARFHAIFQRPEIERDDVVPEQSRRMILANQAIQRRRAKLQTIANRLAKTRRAFRPRLLRSKLFRQRLEKPVAHDSSPLRCQQSESSTSSKRNQEKPTHAAKWRPHHNPNRAGISSQALSLSKDVEGCG